MVGDPKESEAHKRRDRMRERQKDRQWAAIRKRARLISTCSSERRMMSEARRRDVRERPLKMRNEELPREARKHKEGLRSAEINAESGAWAEG